MTSGLAGICMRGGAFTCFNNLFHHNNMGAKLLSGDAILYNNTFDSNNTAIDYERSSGHILFFKDNLFTLNGQSVALRYSGDDCQHNYNVYWGTPPHIYDYLTQSAVDIGPQSRELVSSPYDAEKGGWEAGWYLKQKPDDGESPDEVLAVDCGSQSSQMSGLDELTTSINLKPDTGIVDIASHHPIDLNRDSDSDTMPDWWEDLNGLDPHDPDDADSDADEDTIYAYQEYGDGTNSTNPNDDDSDHDGIPDADDANPTARTDTDGDGMTDDWETHHFGNLSQGGAGDYDSDGLSNWDEWNLGTDPTNPDTDSDGIQDGNDKDPNGPKLTIVSLTPPKTATDATEGEFWHPALVTSSPVFRLAGIADARLRNVKVFVNNPDGANPGFAALIEPTEFEMKYVPLGGEGKYNIMVKAYDFDDNEAYAFTQVEVSYTAPPAEAWIKVHEAVEEYDRLARVWAAFELPDEATPLAGYINGEPATVTGTLTGTVSRTNLPLGRGANVITARLVYTYGAAQYEITDTGTVYFHIDSPAHDFWSYHETPEYGCDMEDMEQYRDHEWFYDSSAHPDGYFYVETEEPPYGDCRFSAMLGPWQLRSPDFQERVSLIHIEGPDGEVTRELQSCLYRTYPAIGVADCDYLVYVHNPSCFNEPPLPAGYMLDGRQLIYITDDKCVARMRLTPASDYAPTLQAPYRDYGEDKGRRFVCNPHRPEPYYIVLSLQKGQGEDPYYIDWQDMDIGDPVIQGEWVDVLARYNPAGGEIEWEHSPSDPGWTGEPLFKPLVVGEHTITARYYTETNEPERSLVGYVEDTVTFRVLEAPGIHLLSEVPKDKLLIGERMPLFVRFVNLNEQKQLDEIDASIIFFELGKIVEEGPGEVVETPCWQLMLCSGIPPEPLHDEYWFVFTVAGLSEGKVKLQPKVKYKLNGETAFTEVVGPQYDVEVCGFVDVRLDSVGEWGEEDPGAFISKTYPDWLTLRTCTAGNVVLSWDSDSVALYTDLPWEEYNKVVEDDGSVEGSRRATFNPQYETPPEKDDWDTVFRTTRLWAKAVETSSIVGDIHLTLSPVSGQAPSDLVNLSSVELASVEATIPSTPCRTLRPPNAGSIPSRVFTSAEAGATWAAGHSIVLIYNSTDDVPLKANVEPDGTSLRWEVIRNPDDAGSLRADPFPAREGLSLTGRAGDTTGLSLDAVGSFSIVCYVDHDGNNRYDEGTDPGRFLSLVVAYVAHHQDQSVARPFAQQHWLDDRPVLVDGNPVQATLLLVRNGQWAWGEAGVELRNQVDVVGGGADGRLGVDRILTGWCNNVWDDVVEGTYEGLHSTATHLPNENIAQGGLVNFITNPGNLPAPMNPPLSADTPLLDTGNPDPGTGGITACLSSSTDTRAARQNLLLGERRTTEAVDSPGQLVMLLHPRFPGSRLTTMDYRVQFRAYLVIWTGTNTGAPVEPGASLYSVAVQAPWYLTARYTLVWPGGGGPPDILPDGTNTISLQDQVVHSPCARMEALTGELYPPTIVQRATTRDATN